MNEQTLVPDWTRGLFQSFGVMLSPPAATVSFSSELKAIKSEFCEGARNIAIRSDANEAKIIIESEKQGYINGGFILFVCF